MKLYKSILAGLIIVLLLAGTAFATDGFSFLKDEYANLSEEELVAKLANKSFDELIADLNSFGDKIDQTGMIYFGDALVKKARTIPELQIMSEILDESNSDLTKVLLLQVNSFIGNTGTVEGNIELREMLSRNDVDFEIKRNILINFYKGSPESTDIFEDVLMKDDDRLAFHALKLLNYIDPQKAIKYADDILVNYQNNPEFRVRAAVKVKASQLENSSLINEKQEFIKLCKNIFAENRSEEMNGTIAFALSGIKDKEGISFIVKNDEIMREIKSYCIDQNHVVLESMLKEQPAEEEVKTVVEAMTIHPLKGMEKLLENVKSSLVINNKNLELIKHIDSTIQLIQEKGENASKISQ